MARSHPTCWFISGLLLLSLCTPPKSRAQPGDPSSFAFLRFEPSARTAALGGAFGAMDDGDLAGLFYNPALLQPEAHRSVQLSYLNHLSDVNAGTVSHGHTFERWGTAGIGLRFVSWGEIEGANEVGERTGTFGAGDIALTFGLGRALGASTRYGGAAHLIHSYIDDARASALAIDLGVLHRIPAQQLTLSASVNNLGRALDSFGPERSTLPTDVRLGLAKTLAHLPLTLSALAYNLHELDEGLTGGTTLDHVLGHLTLGGEIQLIPAFHARIGYNHRRSHELGRGSGRFDWAGLGLGFGLTIRGITLDYAYNSWSSYGGLHWFTLRI